MFFYCSVKLSIIWVFWVFSYRQSKQTKQTSFRKRNKTIISLEPLKFNSNIKKGSFEQFITENKLLSSIKQMLQVTLLLKKNNVKLWKLKEAA